MFRGLQKTNRVSFTGQIQSPFLQKKLDKVKKFKKPIIFRIRNWFKLYHFTVIENEWIKFTAISLGDSLRSVVHQ